MAPSPVEWDLIPLFSERFRRFLFSFIVIKEPPIDSTLVASILWNMIVRSIYRWTTFPIHPHPLLSVAAADRGRQHATFYSNPTSTSTTMTTQRMATDEELPSPPPPPRVALAQMNYARLVAPMDDDRMKEFALAMDPINQLARSTPGYLWSFDNDHHDPHSHHHDHHDHHDHHPMEEEDDNFDSRMARSTVDLLRDDPLIQPQLSLWKDMNSLRHFVFKSGHAMYYKRKKEWFHPPTPDMIPYSVCWWHEMRCTTATNASSFQPPSLKEAFDRCHQVPNALPKQHHRRR
jgi:Domain of unknown function (DUF3291)